VELVRANLGMDAASSDKIAHLDAEKAAKYLAQAKEELAAAGLTFPIVIEYYTDNNQGALDNAAVLKQCIEDALGTDFVEVKIGTYVKLADVRDSATQAFAIFGYGGVVADPSTYLRHYLYNDTAWWTNKYLHTNNLPEDSDIVAIMKQFTELYNKADAIVDDNDARMAAFAEAEALLQEHAITIPCYITNGLQLTRIDPNSQMISQLAGMDSKMKNWVTNVDGFTRAQIEANANGN
jgi:oligopeptide transport system substrate-binding protein